MSYINEIYYVEDDGDFLTIQRKPQEWTFQQFKNDIADEFECNACKLKLIPIVDAPTEVVVCWGEQQLESSNHHSLYGLPSSIESAINKLDLKDDDKRAAIVASIAAIIESI